MVVTLHEFAWRFGGKLALEDDLGYEVRFEPPHEEYGDTVVYEQGVLQGYDLGRAAAGTN
jgi:hypothetical protein